MGNTLFWSTTEGNGRDPNNKVKNPFLANYAQKCYSGKIKNAPILFLEVNLWKRLKLLMKRVNYRYINR